MPALLPTPHGQHAHASPPQAHGGQIPAGSRLSALHLNGGMPPMPPLSGGLMPTNGAAGTAFGFVFRESFDVWLCYMCVLDVFGTIRIAAVSCF
jgi:hypothetical protein